MLRRQHRSDFRYHHRILRNSGVEVVHRIQNPGRMVRILSGSCPQSLSLLQAQLWDFRQILLKQPMLWIPCRLNLWNSWCAERPEAIDLLNQVQNGVPTYMIIPLILVIGLAISGVNTFACIGSGIVSAYILGLFCGNYHPSPDPLNRRCRSCNRRSAGLPEYVYDRFCRCRRLGSRYDDVGCLPSAELWVKWAHSIRLQSWL